MLVEIRLLLSFRDKAPDGGNPFQLELAPGTTAGQLLELLSIPASAAKVMSLNGRLAKGEQVLQDGDQLTVFPPLEGG